MSKSLWNLLLVVCLITFLLVGAGCSSSPKVDASNETTFNESILEIVKSLPKEDQKKFGDTLAGMAMMVALSTDGNEEDIRNFFDGMTYDDIMAKAQEIRDKMKNEE